jgi:hypothetical protein
MSISFPLVSSFSAANRLFASKGEGHMRRFRIALIAIIAAAAGSLFMPGQASATPYPETWLPDSGLHTYCFTAGFSSSIDPGTGTYAMSILDSTTDMTISNLGACSANTTDVWWFALDLAGTIRGQAECIFFSGSVCDSADVRIDFAQIDIGDNDIADRDKTSVHEIGHTIGLGHHSPASHNCAMISGEIPSLDIIWRRYDAHDISHINAQF